MYQFIDQHQIDIHGVLSGFDRIRFRGTIRWFGSVRGVMSFLWEIQVRLTQFTDWAKGLTQQIVETSEQIAATAGRPMTYLYSSAASKEAMALQVAQADNITDGLVCVFKCVEPCQTFKVSKNAQTRRLEMRQILGKCSHYYFYVMHPRFGLLHLRLQTYFPFTIHVCLNGREWLARDLSQQNIGFEQRDNCFAWIEDIPAAQKLADQQLQADWSGLLDDLRRMFHPLHETMYGKLSMQIYWSAEETEWATDVMFKSPAALERLYPALVRHAINDPRDMKVYRPKANGEPGERSWLRLRKGVADLHRRAEVSQQSNERYLDALAAVNHDQLLGEVVEEICQPAEWKGRRVRALQPFSPDDSRLLAAVNQGEFAINGFRNRDLRELLFGIEDVSPAEAKRQAARITRQVRLLRGHGLIKKVQSTHRYTLTSAGRIVINALLAAQHTTPQQLAQLAV